MCFESGEVPVCGFPVQFQKRGGFGSISIYIRALDIFQF